MKIATDVLCPCGAPFHEIADEHGTLVEAVCGECGRRETWPEHQDASS